MVHKHTEYFIWLAYMHKYGLHFTYFETKFSSPPVALHRVSTYLYWWFQRWRESWYAVLSGNHCKSLRIPNGFSVFTAEAIAINWALDFISCFLADKFLLFSDSLSVVKDLNHTSSRKSQIQKRLEKHHEIANTLYQGNTFLLPHQITLT